MCMSFVEALHRTYKKVIRDDKFTDWALEKKQSLSSSLEYCKRKSALDMQGVCR